ncbi:MAG: menaquinol-cytochrome c reductase cytochrome b subunit [Acidimicrobiales bacterium]|jgi:menaquinol-cytochrome c reductase cytochrome b/c subunit
MTEIPAHLLNRSKSARAAATGGDTAPDASGDDDGETIPRALLEKSQAGGGGAVAAPSGGGVATLAPPMMTGPGGNTHRLLTVVKSGSIQDVKASPGDKVHVWPHLLAAEFTSALFITAFVLVFSLFINAPLLELADFNATPNPSKAPWYFLGLQELLTMFDPMIAGVTAPGVVLVLLGFAPYMDRNPSKAPEDRKFAISIMTIHLMFWAVLVIIGSFFRGQGFNFTYPWDTGLHGIFHL